MSAGPEIDVLYAATAAPHGDLDWFDAHTHIGQNDPDGVTGTAEELLAGLDGAGHRRALTFAMHEPSGYRDANDAILAACAASDGRLLPLGRIAPGSAGALDEARRCLDAGAHGIKLHPRSDDFGLDHPDVEAVVALVAERGGIVLFHAGRGIPQLGEHAVRLATEHPAAHLILAHAAVSDLGMLAEPAARLPNLLFDTAWWHPSDVLQLFATIPPGNILYASDMPYGPGQFTALSTLRMAAAVGLGTDVVREICGGQLDRLLAGHDPLDLGPAPGTGAIGPRELEYERVASYAGTAAQLAFRLQDPTEAISLARSGAQTRDTGAKGELLRTVDVLLARSLERVDPDAERPSFEALGGVLAAALLVTTPALGVPDVVL
jgi:predicted TIM-barrel fold metal-dependent hydrolase